MTIRKPVFLTATEGFEEEFLDSDGIKLGSLIIGAGSESAGNINMSGTGKIVNLVDPTGAQDAATKNWVEDFVNNLDHKESVRVKTPVSLGNVVLSGGAPNSVDNVSLALGNRVLVTEQTNATENGIYVVQTVGTGNNGTWVRSSDADENNEVADGMSTWVGEGNTHADQRWTLKTNDTITLGSTNLVFIQTSGSGSIPVGTATAGGVGAVIGRLGGDSDKGIAITSGIVSTKIDAVTLDYNGSGQIAVTGLPLNFEINGVSVGGDVTGPNLDTLTDGSNADSLHTHQSLEVDEASRVEDDYTANENISAYDPVYWQANDKIGRGDSGNDAKAHVFGVAREAILQDAQGPVVTYGLCSGVLNGLGATVNDPVFLKASGGLTLTRPATGNRIIVMGYAMNALDLFVQIRDYGKRAA